jgi:hypothetical protein
MLDENDVIDAVSFYLLETGYTIVYRSSTDRQGVDIVARHHVSGARIFISVAGVARSKAGKGKLEMAYTESQVFRSVTRAIYSALKKQEAGQFEPGDQIALAFPDLPSFRKYLNAEKSVMDALRVKIFLVTEKKSVVML